MRVIHRFTPGILLLSLAVGCGGRARMPVAVSAPQTVAADAEPAKAAARGEPKFVPDGKYALLVGVTTYPNLRGRDLEGPANDVLLMRQLLTRFGFAAGNIVTLSEAEGRMNPARLPARANIERELRRLGEVSKKDDQVVVFLAGHGTVAPESADDPQPDGREKLYLPRDIAAWDARRGGIPNAIRGRELKQWLLPIPRKQARLWVIMDCCHSGGIVRGAEERERKLLPRDLQVPADALDQTQRAAQAAADPLRLATQDGVVAVYACQSSETTIERGFPADGAKEKPFGLLTYTLNEVLTQAKGPLSYRDLVTQVLGRYRAMPRSAPTPLVEGADQDRVILGTERLRRTETFRVTEEDGQLRIDGGRLHGLTEGTILAVFPAAGAAEANRVIGHVEVTSVGLSRSQVKPCEYDKSPKPTARQVTGGQTKVVEVDYGDLKLKVAVDPADANGRKLDAGLHERLAKDIQAIAAEKSSLVRPAANLGDADWLLRADGGRVHLVPAARWKAEEGAAAPGRRGLGLLAPLPVNDGLQAELKSRLERIARAENLKRLAGGSSAPAAGDDLAPQLKVELYRLRDKADRQGELVPGPAMTFQAGDRVRYRIRNLGRSPVDVTLLYIDSGYGIEALFPVRGELNRIPPGGKVDLPAVTVDDETFGPEQAVLIAVPASEDLPIDFTNFAQKTIEQAKKVNQRSAGTGVGRLLGFSLYGHGTRGMHRPQEEPIAFQLVPITTVPRKTPK